MSNRQLAIIALAFIAILVWLLACDDTPTPPAPKAQVRPTPKQTDDFIYNATPARNAS